MRTSNLEAWPNPFKGRLEGDDDLLPVSPIGAVADMMAMAYMRGRIDAYGTLSRVLKDAPIQSGMDIHIQLELIQQVLLDKSEWPEAFKLHQRKYFRDALRLILSKHVKASEPTIIPQVPGTLPS